ncbi:MAG: DNA repair protein RadC [Verrucomicrobia bacterium]|nr:DNA repair protein RadC [Verrucomicrobiota bacterium]
METLQTSPDVYAFPRNVKTISEVPARYRPRETFERLGAAQVTDDVLIALILRSGARGANVVELSRTLLDAYGSLTAMAKAPVEDLATFHGMGKVKAQVLKASLELATRLSEEETGTMPTVRAPEEAAAVLRERARKRETEAFWVLLLDTKNKLLRNPVEVTSGILDASLVHPREVFKEAIRTSAAAIICAHNHPSGDPAPSSEDIRVTRQLLEAGRVIDIPLLDHIILGNREAGRSNDFFSLRESGLISFGDKN